MELRKSNDSIYVYRISTRRKTYFFFAQSRTERQQIEYELMYSDLEHTGMPYSAYKVYMATMPYIEKTIYAHGDFFDFNAFIQSRKKSLAS